MCLKQYNYIPGMRSEKDIFCYTRQICWLTNHHTKNHQRAGFLRNTGHTRDTDTLYMTSGYLTIQKAPQKLKIAREPHRRKHSSILLRFTFKIHRSLFCWTLSALGWFPLAIMVGQERLTFFFPSNMISSKLLRPQHERLEKSTTMLSGRPDFFITRAAELLGVGYQGVLTRQQLPFWEAAHSGFLAAGASSIPVLKKDVWEALDTSYLPPHIHTGWGKLLSKGEFLVWT